MGDYPGCVLRACSVKSALFAAPNSLDENHYAHHTIFRIIGFYRMDWGSLTLLSGVSTCRLGRWR
jgi:hypothetical protein